MLGTLRFFWLFLLGDLRGIVNAPACRTLSIEERAASRAA